MTLPPLAELKKLLDEVTPGPWKLSTMYGLPGIGFAEEEFWTDPEEKANVKATEIAPDLIDAHIRMVEALAVWRRDEQRTIEDMRRLYREHACTDSQVIDRINHILGDHDA